MSTFLINKIGKNVQIIEQGEIYREYFEDSANVEMMYNTNSNRVTINIKGSVSLTTLDVTEGGYLFMEGVEVLTYASFLVQYALVFLSGGSGPGTTPNLQQVLNEGNTTSEAGTNVIVMQNITGQNSTTIDGNDALFEQVFNDLVSNYLKSSLQPNSLSFNDFLGNSNSQFTPYQIGFANNFYQSFFTPDALSITRIINSNQIFFSVADLEIWLLKAGSNKFAMNDGGFKKSDLINGFETSIDFESITQNNLITFPNESGVILLKQPKRLNFTFFYDIVTDNLQIHNVNVSDNLSISGISKLSTGQFLVSFAGFTDFAKSVSLIRKTFNNTDHKHQPDHEVQSGISGIDSVIIQLFNNNVLQDIQFQYWNFDITEYN